ncbi:hypothetical protein [Henriciella mobilis]|uniref:Uncharacterized protein n=1 Tax=Henriciella mobilis TaxID=2305467 RepID=A0A399RJR7_9PROT|nr:hypothetical protein [Henriciella mobilis]RIJ30574.1 hypothetical protein D1223_08095 [Henriciella mobilis]
MSANFSDDLAYVREVAESGASAPLLGGRFLVWWGLLVTAAYLGHYAILKGVGGLNADAIGMMWIGFIVIALAGHFALVFLFPSNKPGASSAGNRASANVWMASGFVLFSFFTGVMIKSFLDGTASPGFNWSIPLVLGVYGISQLVSGLMARSLGLIVAGWGGIAFVGITVIMMHTPELYLAAAVAAALIVLLPGIMMLREEPSTTV